MLSGDPSATLAGVYGSDAYQQQAAQQQAIAQSGSGYGAAADPFDTTVVD